jgi:hypothetical protein
VFFFNFQNHPVHSASLNIVNSFEFIHLDNMHETVPWTTIPRDELIVPTQHSLTSDGNTNPVDDDDRETTAPLEIGKPFEFLHSNLQIIITPSNQKLNMEQIYLQITDNVIPIFIYVIDQETLSDDDIEQLRFFRTIVPNEPMLFIRIDQLDT